MTRTEIENIATQLLGVAAAFNPKAAATLTGLMAAGKALTETLEAVKNDDPDLWAKVSADFNASLAAFDASTLKDS